MKYRFTRNTPMGGKIIPRNTITPSKSCPAVGGRQLERFLRDKTLVEFDDTKFKVVKENNRKKIMEKMEEANKQEIQSTVEDTRDETVDVKLEDMKMDELKELAKSKGLKYVAVKKSDLIESIKGAL